MNDSWCWWKKSTMFFIFILCFIETTTTNILIKLNGDDKCVDWMKLRQWRCWSNVVLIPMNGAASPAQKVSTS